MNRSIPAAVSLGMTVSSVISSSELGGAIFGAHTFAGEYLRVVASGRAIHRPPVPGETWVVTGEYRHTLEYGQQLYARQCVYQAPRGRLLIQYLANNPAFVGVGEVKATALFGQFGDDLAEVLTSGDIDRLCEVLSRETAARLVAVWADHRGEGELIDYLDTRGFSPCVAGQIRRAWGGEALDVLERNPYFMLAFAAWGTVDTAAQLTGVLPNDPRRMVGAVEAALYEELLLGHTLTDRATLLSKVNKLLGNGNADQALTMAVEEGAIVGEDGIGYQPVGVAALEAGITERIRDMVAGESASQGRRFGGDKVLESIDRQVVFIGDSSAFKRAVREVPLAQLRRTAFTV